MGGGFVSCPPITPRPSFPRLSPGLLAATSSAGRASLFLSAANWLALRVGPRHTSHSLANVNSAMEVICQSLGHVHTVLKYRGRPDATFWVFPPLVDISGAPAVQVKCSITNLSNAEMVKFPCNLNNSTFFFKIESFFFIEISIHLN